MSTNLEFSFNRSKQNSISLRQGDSIRRQLFLSDEINHCKEEFKSKGLLDDIYSNDMILSQGKSSMQKEQQESQISPKKKPKDRQNLKNTIGAENAVVLEKKFSTKKDCNSNKRMNESWRLFGLIILLFVKKFINILRSYSFEIKFKELSKSNFLLLGDLSTDYRYYQRQSLFMKDQPTRLFLYYFECMTQIKKIYIGQQISKFFSTLSDLLIKVIVVHQPDRKFRIIWDFIMLLMMIINLFYIPLKVSFININEVIINSNNANQTETSINQHSYIYLEIFLGLVQIFDMFFSFNTAYYRKGVLITSRAQIAKHYLQSLFSVDLVMLIFFLIMIGSSIENSFVEFILMFRSIKIISILNNFVEMLTLQELQMALYDLCKLILFILFVAHFFCCWFNIIASLERQSGETSTTWQSKLTNIESEFDRYVASLYWAIITMITIGYGDICPTTTIERVFVIIMALLSCGVFAYSVNAIGSIIQNITKKASEFKAQMGQLKRYMRDRGMSLVLQMKVQKYFEYLHAESQNSNENCQKMIDTLPKALKNEVQLDIYIRLLQSQKTFFLNFSNQFLRELSLKMKEVRIGVDEIIFNQKEYIDKIYFLMHGEVQQFVKLFNQQDRVLRVYQPGAIIGRIPFFTGIYSEFSIRAINVAQLVYLSKSDFLETIQKYQTDFEKYHKIKDQYLQNLQSKDIGSSCPACGAFNHYFTKCPYINYIPNRAKVFRKIKLNEERIQERESYKRTQKKFASALCTQNIIKDCVIQYILQHQEDVEYLKDQEDLELIMEYIEEIEKYHQVDDAIYLENSLFLDDKLDTQVTNYGTNGNQQQTFQQFQRELSIKDLHEVIKKQTLIPSCTNALQQEESPLLLGQQINNANNNNNRRVSYQRDSKRRESKIVIEEMRQQYQQLQQEKSSPINVKGDQQQPNIQTNGQPKIESENNLDRKSTSPERRESQISKNQTKILNEVIVTSDQNILDSKEIKNEVDQLNRSSMLSISNKNYEQSRSYKSQFSMGKKSTSIQKEKTIQLKMLNETDHFGNGLQENSTHFSNMSNFDKYFEWTIYNPNFNITKIINKMNQFADNNMDPNDSHKFIKRKFMRKQHNKLINLQQISQEDSQRILKYNQYIERDKEQTIAQLRQKNIVQQRDSQQFSKSPKQSIYQQFQNSISIKQQQNK